MLNSIATQKPVTSNPLIIDEANRIINALITKVSRPKVKILIGKVIKIKIGLSKIFNSAKNKASQSTVQKPATVTPGIKYELIIMVKTMINHFKSKFIYLKLN